MFFWKLFNCSFVRFESYLSAKLSHCQFTERTGEQ